MVARILSIRPWLISLWALVLPFWDTGASILLALIFLMAIGRTKLTSWAWLPILTLGVMAMSMWWLPDTAGMPDRLFFKLPLILLPIALYGQSEALLRGWRWALVAVTVFLLWRAAWTQAWTYREFAEGIHQHVYVSMTLVLGLFALWARDNEWPLRMRWLITVAALTCIALMGSRMVVAALAVTAVVAGLSWSAKRLAVLGLLVAAFAVAQVTGNLRGLGHVWGPAKPYWATGSVDTRRVQAQAAWEVWEPQFWQGVGAAPLQPALEASYERMEYRFGLKRHLNIHNQYLHFGVSYGALAMVLWMLLMALMLWRFGLPTLTRVEWALMVAFFLILLTENFLERALGQSLWWAAWIYLAERAASKSESA